MVPTPEQLRHYVADKAERAKIAANLIEHHRAQMATFAGVRRDAIREMREEGYSVASIAAAVGLKEPQVYALLSNDPKAPPSKTEWTLPKLVKELSETARQARHVVEGSTPDIPLGPVGNRLLAEELEEAARRLIEMAQVLAVDLGGTDAETVPAFRARRIASQRRSR